MGVKLLNIASIREEDITTPSATQKYPLGTVIQVQEEGTLKLTKYVYVQAHAGLTAYKPYLIYHDGIVLKTSAPVTGAGIICIPQVAFTSGYYGFVAIEGHCEVLMTAETYAVGDYLQILNAGAALVVDGTSGSTVELVTSCGVCMEAGTTAVARDAYLLGTKADIAAS